MERLAVIDFETTGMSPEQGARAAEVMREASAF
jgi:hypothetical protein